MTKAATTVLQARSELSTQALVAQGTRAGRGHTHVRGCPEHSGLIGALGPVELGRSPAAQEGAVEEMLR